MLIGSLLCQSYRQNLTPTGAIENMQKALGAVKTLRAEFTQLYYSASVSEPLKEHGELFLLKPYSMRWEYKRPEIKVFVAKNGIFEMFIASERQLVRSRIPPEAYDSDIIGLLLGSREIKDTYDAEATRFPGQIPLTYQVKLIPRGEGDFSHILMAIDLKTWFPRRVIFFEWAGNKREYLFDKIRPNILLPKDIFELKVPPGCEIIEDR